MFAQAALSRGVAKRSWDSIFQVVSSGSKKLYSNIVFSVLHGILCLDIVLKSSLWIDLIDCSANHYDLDQAMRSSSSTFFGKPDFPRCKMLAMMSMQLAQNTWKQNEPRQDCPLENGDIEYNSE